MEINKVNVTDASIFVSKYNESEYVSVFLAWIDVIRPLDFTVKTIPIINLYQ